MAAAHGTAGRGFSAGNVSSLETEDITVSGANGFMMAFPACGAGSPVAPSAVKWGGSGGTSMTQQGTTITVETYGRHSAYKLTAPTSQTAKVYCDWGSNQDETILIAEFATGIDQTTPIRNFAQNLSNQQSPSAAVTSVAGDLCLSSLFLLSGSTASKTLTAGSPGTAAKVVDQADVGGYEVSGVQYYTATGTSTTLSWTIAGEATAFNNWVNLFTIALTPASGGGGGGSNLLAKLQQHGAYL